MNNFELKPTDKEEHFRLIINGVDVTGEQHQTVFVHLIEKIDKTIFKV
jgi:hypothetical protein